MFILRRKDTGGNQQLLTKQLCREKRLLTVGLLHVPSSSLHQRLAMKSFITSGTANGMIVTEITSEKLVGLG